MNSKSRREKSQETKGGFMEKLITIQLEKSDFRNITGLIETHLNELEKQRDFYKKRYAEMTILGVLVKNWKKILTVINKELAR